jgi:hypothetical protein
MGFAWDVAQNELEEKNLRDPAPPVELEKYF